MGISTAKNPRPLLTAAMLDYVTKSNTLAPYVTKCVPYSFGGWRNDVVTANGIIGWDCSGVMAQAMMDLGFRNLPDVPASWYANRPYHPGPALAYNSWDMLYTVAKSATDGTNIVQGDVLVWNTHVAVAVDSENMVSALSQKYGTFVSPIVGWGPEPTFTVRRMLWSHYEKIAVA